MTPCCCDALSMRRGRESVRERGEGERERERDRKMGKKLEKVRISELKMAPSPAMRARIITPGLSL